MRYSLLLLGALTAIMTSVSANTNTSLKPTIAQPTTCVNSLFTATGNQHWKSIVLKLTNNCNQAVDFQNSTVSFQTTAALNTSFWGDFSPLSYPDNALNISSQPQSDGNYLATLNLHFPSYPGANSKLPVGSSISIKYGATTDSHIEGTANVYLSTTVESGSIQLINAATKPTNVSQGYALERRSINF